MARNTGHHPAFARSTRLVALVGGVLLTCAGIVPSAYAATVDIDGDGAAAGDCAPLDPSVGPLAPDLPDLAFTDTNCDGIDGNAATAVFVAPDGSDANPGTQAQPLRTLQAAVDRAATGGRQVYAAVGSYDGRVVFGTNHDGLQVYGGYQRGTLGSRTTSLHTTVSGQPEAVVADGATDIVLQLVHLQATRGTSLSAYGIRAVNGSEVALVASSVSAGPGGAGQPGGNGSTPAKAASGAAGATPVNCDTPGVPGNNSAQFGSGTDGGAGGAGGQETNDGENGQTGNWGGGIGGGTPGAGGVDTAGDSSPAGHGQNGSPGQPGAAGSPGAGGGGDLGAAGTSWAGRNGSDGGNGGPGYGGGGGGGGAGNGAWHGWGTGAGGGQGGEGGAGGSRGTGGRFGGGSFGIYLFNSQVVVDDSTVAAGAGGAGGSGGLGAPGGAGGDGGVGGAARSDCGMPAGNGGDGGNGGPGGVGGNGGGASGGPSAAVFRGGDSLATVVGDSTLTHGTGGSGGDGWAAAGDGASGQAAPLLGAVGTGSTDFDGDTHTDTADVCPTVPGGIADANGDGCPEPPDTTITKGPANGSFVLSTSTAFGFASSESGSAFTCSLDDRAGSVCPASPTFANLAQRTHLLRVWARDPDGSPDPTPTTRVWTVPLNNTALGQGRGWAKNRGPGYYLSTYSQATKRGATLSEKISGVRRIALVATRGRGFGTVNVYLGTKLLKKVSLGATSTRKKQLISVASFASPRSGTVRIVVASTGKTIRVEGLGVATR